VFEKVLSKNGKGWQWKVDFVWKRSLVRCVGQDIVLLSLIVVLRCSKVRGVSYVLIRPIVQSLQSERQKSAKFLMKLKLLRRFACSGSQWKTIRTNILIVYVTGKWVPRVWLMHSVVPEEMFCERCLLSEKYAVRPVSLSNLIWRNCQLMLWALALMRVLINRLDSLWF